MKGSFSIEVDQCTSFVRIIMSGFFELADIQRFVASRDIEHRRLRCSANGHTTLVDIRGMKIQSQASVEEFTHILRDPKHASRKIAFVVETSLARQQIQRAATGRGAGFFLGVEEAEAWLREPLGRKKAMAEA